MSENNGYSIRKGSTEDIDFLISFFNKAYGSKTVFQNPEFLSYYFSSFNNQNKPLSANLIGVIQNGEIISHYGGLHYQLQLDSDLVSGFWGVNAFTLPEWRGHGINSTIVKLLASTNDFNAVIGMPYEAPHFYKKYGYNIFDKQTLSRFIFVLNNKTFDIIDYLGNDIEKAKELLNSNIKTPDSQDIREITELNSDNIDQYDVDLTANVRASTYRSKEFLKWRIFNNPYIQYKVYGYLKNKRILSYVVIREEVLNPQKYKISRIIDLFGSENYIDDLLRHTIKHAENCGSIYIDFSAFGSLYDMNLLDLGFAKLDNDDCCLLPQVSAPVENRPNHEFMVLQSVKHKEKVDSLTKENVYFTRIDGDRDRIAQLSQIRNIKHG